MLRFASFSAAAAALQSTCAVAQPFLFIDNFNGPVLSPGWMQPPASSWAYTVTGGFLNVTGLFIPNTPPKPNSAVISSSLEPAFTTFEANVRMGMNTGAGREMRYTAVSFSGSPLASFGWSDATGIVTEVGGSIAMFPPPPPGIHEFTIQRTTDQYKFLLDGTALVTLTGSTGIFGRMELRFTGPSTLPLAPMYVDRVAVLAAIGVQCYPNCDGSSTEPILNIGDFICFLNRFAAGDSYANCDGTSLPPILSISDFICFTNRFAAGCL